MWNNVVLMRKWSQLTLLRLLHTKKDPAAEHWWGPGNSCLLDIARLTLNRLICLLMKKSANWTMCEYNVCITNASVAINFRAFDLVYMVKTFHDARNYLKRFNFKDFRASSLFGIIPKHSVAISPTWPKSVHIPCWACRLAWQCVGRIYNTMHASWSSPACLWKTKQTGLNSKFPVGASSSVVEFNACAKESRTYMRCNHHNWNLYRKDMGLHGLQSCSSSEIQLACHVDSQECNPNKCSLKARWAFSRVCMG